MLKSAHLKRLTVIAVIASLMLTGCWHPFKPGDDQEYEEGNRTFAISDTYPYPGKNYQIPDKQVGVEYDLYIYIINNGGHEKDNVEAKDVKVSVIDETRSVTINVATTSIAKGVGYAVIENLAYDREAKVHFHVEGTIIKNKNQKFTAKVNSNSFWIKGSGSEPPPPEPEEDGLLIWEREIIEE